LAGEGTAKAFGDDMCLWERIYVVGAAEESDPPIQDNGDGYCTKDKPFTVTMMMADCKRDFDLPFARDMIMMLFRPALAGNEMTAVTTFECPGVRLCK